MLLKLKLQEKKLMKKLELQEQSMKLKKQDEKKSRNKLKLINVMPKELREL